MQQKLILVALMALTAAGTSWYCDHTKAQKRIAQLETSNLHSMMDEGQVQIALLPPPVFKGGR